MPKQTQSRELKKSRRNNGRGMVHFDYGHIQLSLFAIDLCDLLKLKLVSQHDGR